MRRGAGDNEHEFEIMLGRDDTDSRLTRFTRVYRLHLAGEGSSLERVDTRYPNGMTITRSGPVAQDENGGKA